VASEERRREFGPPSRTGRAVAAVRATRGLVALGTAVLLTLAAVQQARATTYKWVDDKGVTHYSDKLPVEAVNRGNTVLDKQALPIKKVEPAPTADQIRSKQTESERAQAAAREQAIQDRRDRALMQSYASESEIDLAKNRALMTIDSQLEAARVFSAQLVKRKDALIERKARLGEKGLPVAEERELETTVAEIAKQQALIDQRQKEREAAVVRYDADKARYRELRPVADAKDPPAVNVRSSADAAAPAASRAAVTRK
jgi:hypothetical protein